MLTYNKIRQQFSLQGNTPEEIFLENLHRSTIKKLILHKQKTQRTTINQQNKYKTKPELKSKKPFNRI